MIARSLALVLLYLTLVPSLWAQITWRRAYGAFGPDHGGRVKVLPGGEFIVAGNTGSFGAGDGDAYVLRLDALGSMLGSYAYGSENTEHCTGLTVMQDGSWILGGYSNATLTNGYDGWLMKAGPDGSLAWERSYGGADWDILESLEPTEDGGFVMAGRTYSTGGGGSDGWIVCVDGAGDTLWTRTFGTSGEEALYDVRETADGGYIAAGYKVDTTGDQDAWIIRLAADLSVVWDVSVGGDSIDSAADVVATSDGGYSVVGSTRSFSIWAEHMHAKVDGNGVLQWIRNWGQINDQEAQEHLELNDGSFLSAGYTRTSGGGGSDMFLLKSDPSGDFIFGRTFGGEADDAGFSLDTLTDGFVMAGTTRSFGAGNEDVFVVRTDLNGQTALETVESSFDPLDVRTIVKVDPQLTIFPSPSTGALTVRSPSLIRQLSVHDVMGRLVLQRPATDRELRLELELPAGTYVVSVVTDQGTVLRRSFILQRP